jgi:hypothetical protein
MSLQALTEELTAFKATFQEKAKTAIEATFKEFFVKFPEVSRIYWTQYTPYFNDGDPCTFSVNGVSIYLTKEGRAQFGLDPEDEGDEDDDGDEGGDLYSLSIWDRNAKETRYISPRAEELYSAVKEIDKGMQGVEDALEVIYGDHVQVTIRRNGSSEVDEYEHD